MFYIITSKKLYNIIIMFFLVLLFTDCYAEIIAGYQGWYGCPNDYKTNKSWQHWMINGQFTVDVLPDVSIYPQNILCDTGIKNKKGETVKLFSSQNGEVVKTHIKIAEKYGIDVLAIQRFVNEISTEWGLSRRNNLLQNIVHFSKNKRVKFFIMYDVSGSDSNVYAQIMKDLQDLKRVGVFGSSNYYQINNKPLLGIWGFGFTDRVGSPEETISLIRQIKSSGFIILGGIPSRWRTMSDDSKPDKRWLDVYLEYDILSPWFVGRFKDWVSLDSFYNNIVQKDIDYLTYYHKDKKYLPVVFPGFSWYNLQSSRNNKHSAKSNQIPRHCGLFMQEQIQRLKKMGIHDFYVAMFDEFDESTALLPVITDNARLPANSRWKFILPSHDNCQVATPFYLLEIIKNNK